MHFLEDQCANCDARIPGHRPTSLFCTSRCKKTAALVQWERVPRTIQDLQHPGYQWALESRVLFARTDDEDTTAVRHRLLNELDERINSPAPLRWCDCPEWKPALTQRLIRERKLRRDAKASRASQRLSVDLANLADLTASLQRQLNPRQVTELVQLLQPHQP